MVLLLSASTAPDVVASAAAERLRIEWSDLLTSSKPATREALAEPAKAGTATPVAADLDGRPIELSGFIVPVDREGSLVYQFLLVPWVGACSHVPPPPPDQIVLVTPDRPYEAKEIFEPVTVSGTLQTDDELSQLFLFDGTIMVRSGYSLRRAGVLRTADAPAATPLSAETPWSFLK